MMTAVADWQHDRALRKYQIYRYMLHGIAATIKLNMYLQCMTASCFHRDHIRDDRGSVYTQNVL